MRRVRSIDDVVRRQMCLGCGACAYVSPDEIRMADVPELGRRPVLAPSFGADPRSREALRVCPGAELAHPPEVTRGRAYLHELMAGWGPVIALWEGFATDPEIRFRGSSGGAATALALYCLERGGMHGVLHTAPRKDAPYLLETVLSHDRAGLLAGVGSRYAPASPCDGLQRIEEAAGPCVFVGKPCDAAGAARAASLRPALAKRLGVRIALFCAGTPSTNGTLEMLRKMGINDLAAVRSVRYRGHGWPGRATVRFERDGAVQEASLSYGESWGDILQRHRPWRCYVCADHTGEFADIAVGDPWYREIPAADAGQSLVLARTERGRRIIEGAIAAGYLELKPAEAWVLPASQPNLLSTRGAIFARIWVSWLLGAAAPRYRGLPQLRFWLSQLSLKEKAQSIYGTVKRVFTRHLYRRIDYTPSEPGAGERRKP